MPPVLWSIERKYVELRNPMISNTTEEVASASILENISCNTPAIPNWLLNGAYRIYEMTS